MREPQGGRFADWEWGALQSMCAEGNQISVDGGQTAQYVYDALNQRVWLHTSGNSSEQEPAYQEIDYDLNGKRLSIWDGSSGNLQKVQLYWGSRPVAFYTPGAIHFQHGDWLGSERVTTSYNGAAESTIGHYPFGEVKSSSGNQIDAYQFGQLDNNDDNTEHAQFREYENGQGHWLAPDPYDGSYDPTNPQSFNRYAYVLNSPLSYVDPSGLSVTYIGGGCYRIVETWSTQYGDENPAPSDPTEFVVCTSTPNSSPVVVASVSSGSNSGSGGGTNGAVVGPDSTACAKKATTDVIKGAIYYDQVNWLAGKINDGLFGTSGGSPTVDPGLQSVPGSSTISAASSTASFIAGSKLAQGYVRQFVRAGGGSISMRRVGTLAGTFGKYAGAIGTALTAYSAYNDYQYCMGR